MRRSIVTGAPGAGKTTLLEALRLRGFVVVREAAADVITAGQAAGVDEPWTASGLFDDIRRLQVQSQGEAPAAAVVLFDRSPIRTLALPPSRRFTRRRTAGSVSTSPQTPSSTGWRPSSR